MARSSLAAAHSDGLSALKRLKRLSLAEEIADAVAEAIATNHLKSGDRIVELALAARMEVSRVPVREALKVLHAQGIITGGGHRSYRVAAFDDETVHNVVELRMMLESILLRGAIRNWRAGHGDLSDLTAALDAMQDAAQTGNRLASLAADLDFHRGICQAAGNDIAATLWETIARHVMIIFNRAEYRDDDLHAIVRQHRNFLSYIRSTISDPKENDARIEAALQDHLLQVSRAKQRNPAARP